MKIKTKLIKNSSGEYLVKTTIKKGGKNIIKYFTPEDLGVSNVEIPSIDFRSKILERLK